MNAKTTLEEFISSYSPTVDMDVFAINLLLAFILSFVVGQIYVRFGHSVSNRKTFSRNLVIVATTTMFVITIVKSSLALSLGLVGALSIVRFRTPIKEPEELSYLFLAIAIGLGLGADQRAITIIAVVLISFILISRKLKSNAQIASNNLYITIQTEKKDNISLSSVVEELKKQCSEIDIRRFDEVGSMLEASFRVQLTTIENLDNLRTALRCLDENINISFVDQHGIIE